MKRNYFFLVLSVFFLVFTACDGGAPAPLTNIEQETPEAIDPTAETTSKEQAKASLKLQALYFRGGQSSKTQKGYLKDKFFQIYNPTDVEVPIANLAILESDLLTGTKYMNLSVSTDDAFIVAAAFKVPASSTKMLKPGEKLVLSAVGKDHKVDSQPGLDLSTSDFEWFEDIQSTNPNVFSEDTDVPNLQKLYSYSKNFWTPHGQGGKSFAIAYIAGTELEKIDYTYDLEHFNNKTQTASVKSFDKSGVMLHPDSIIDAVNTVTNGKGFEFNPFPTKLDAGYATIEAKTPCVLIVRKDYMDTNNSTEDFKQINLNTLEGSPITDPRDSRLKKIK